MSPSRERAAFQELISRLDRAAARRSARALATYLRAIARHRMLDQSPAPVELGHRLIDNREARMLFEIVGRNRPDQERLPATADHPA
ncbi:MAG TPA: hypothetical protein VGX76_10400 [Pirellulales bacterium]|nr:hypothetical protein [Pirellulales bacterium]